jgi:multidrug efflux system membrane fusion protein
MRVRRSLFCAGLVVAALSVVGLKGIGRHGGLWQDGSQTQTPAAPSPLQVPVAKVVIGRLSILREYPARIEAIRNVQIQAKVGGFIQAKSAADGSDVEAGDLLYKIDDRDYVAVLDGAEAQVSRDKAVRDYALSAFTRSDELSKRGFLAKDILEQRASTLAQAEAALAQDLAAVRTARINLAYTEVRAPYAGRLGRDRAPPGTLVSGAGSILNTLVQLAPIYVSFNPSDSDLADIRREKARGSMRVSIQPAGAGAFVHAGELTFIDNTVDRSTATIAVRATISNADLALLPGQYVHVRLQLREEPNALLVPQVAVGSNQFGRYVYVLTQDGTAERRLVTLGSSNGELVSVTGLHEGEQVITGNLQKVEPGGPVVSLPSQTALE